MTSSYALTTLSDQDLLERLAVIVAKTNQVTATLLAHIAEVDARKLYLARAASSMHVYCTEILNFSDCAAYKRIHAARTARAYPVIFELIAKGDLHLAGVTMLATHLTPENHRELLAAASRKSKRAIEELIAARAPKPDVQPTIRKLPGPPAPTLFDAPKPAAPRTPPPKAPPPKPLSEDRFKVQFTASRALTNKIATAKALLRHAVPDGDLEQVFERAVDALIEKLQKKKFAATTKPTSEEPKPSVTRYIPAAVKRAVIARDGHQCTFVDPKTGRRCCERALLEFDHVIPYAKGGKTSVENLRMRCRAHNGHHADREYGADFMKRKKQQAPGQAQSSESESPPPPVSASSSFDQSTLAGRSPGF